MQQNYTTISYKDKLHSGIYSELTVLTVLTSSWRLPSLDAISTLNYITSREMIPERREGERVVLSQANGAD